MTHKITLTKVQVLDDRRYYKDPATGYQLSVKEQDAQRLNLGDEWSVHAIYKKFLSERVLEVPVAVATLPFDPDEKEQAWETMRLMNDSLDNAYEDWLASDG